MREFCEMVTVLVYCSCLQVSTESGHVYYCDVRTESPVFTLKAHDDAVAGTLAVSAG